MSKVSILGIGIDSVTMDGAVAVADGFFGGDRPYVVFTPNPEIIMLAHDARVKHDDSFANALNSADLLLPDGIGVVIASKILKNPLAARVAGFDFVCRMLETGRSAYLFGAKPGVADTAAEILRGKGVNIVGTHDGYFTDDTPIIDDINQKAPDILLVCLGAPKQELWITKNLNKLNVGLCVGAGGTLDAIAGTTPLAPDFIRRIGFEWLYRAVRQPSRFVRLAAIPRFFFAVITAKKIV